MMVEFYFPVFKSFAAKDKIHANPDVKPEGLSIYQYHFDTTVTTFKILGKVKR